MRLDLSGLPVPPLPETWEERTARELLVTAASRMASMPTEAEARHCYRLARSLAEERANPTEAPPELREPPPEEEEIEP